MKSKLSIALIILISCAGCMEKERNPDIAVIITDSQDTISFEGYFTEKPVLNNFYRHGWNDSINNRFCDTIWLHLPTVLIHDTIYIKKNVTTNIDHVNTLNQ